MLILFGFALLLALMLAPQMNGIPGRHPYPMAGTGLVLLVVLVGAAFMMGVI